MTDLEKLKPCPFCGSEARLLGGTIAQESYSVWCNSKEGRQHHLSGSMDRDATIAAWNTRASDAALLVAEKALREMAALDDVGASEVADLTGSYGCFDEPASVQVSRAALSEIEKLTGGGE